METWEGGGLSGFLCGGAEVGEGDGERKEYANSRQST